MMKVKDKISSKGILFNQQSIKYVSFLILTMALFSCELVQRSPSSFSFLNYHWTTNSFYVDSNKIEPFGYDFMLYRLVSTRNDTIGIYAGMHPNVPQRIELCGQYVKENAFDTSLVSFCNKKLALAKLEDGYSEKVGNMPEFDLDLDTFVFAPYDSSWWNLYNKEIAIISGMGPCRGEYGKVNIIIDLKNEEELGLLHFYSDSLDYNGYKELLEFCSSIH